MLHSHRTIEERIGIKVFVHMGMRCRESARRLGRSHTSISRKPRCNSSKSGYRARRAEHRARKRRTRPRRYRCMSRPDPVPARGDGTLRSHRSPEQIAGRIRLDYPENPGMHISAGPSTAGSMPIPVAAIYHPRRARKRRAGGKAATAEVFFPGVLLFTDRPQPVADTAALETQRLIWSVHPKAKPALIGCIEHKSRFSVLGNSMIKQPVPSVRRLSFVCAGFPRPCGRSPAWPKAGDGGVQGTGVGKRMRTYLCRPHSPLQRGTNENSNGLLRQYFPRGSSFQKLTDEILQRVAKQSVEEACFVRKGRKGGS